MDASAAKADRRPARRLNPEREDAILEATLALLAEDGYDRMSIDGIARRAGASKATIYRRWPGKAQLVVDVVCRKLHDADPIAPDTGRLRDDLTELALAYGRVVERKQTIVFGLVPALMADPDLAEAIRANVPAVSLEKTAAVLDRARSRGELAEPFEARRLLSLIEALVWHRVLFTGAPADPEFAAETVDRVLLPVLGAGT